MRGIKRRSALGRLPLGGALLAMSLLAAACGSTVQGGDTRSALGTVQEDVVGPPTGPRMDGEARGAPENALAHDPSLASPGSTERQTGTEPSASRRNGAVGPAGGEAGPPRQGNSAAPPTPDEHPGVTASAVKVGFIGAANVEAASEALGGGGPEFGDSNAQIRAVVNYVNENGGVGGRVIEPVVRNSDVAGSPNQHESICAGFTQDDQVFAVLSLTAGVDDVIPSCYARNQTLFTTAVFFAMDQKSFDDFSPYYWSASGLNLSGMARLMARGLHARGFYDGEKLGVLYNDNATFRRVYDGVLKPELARLGVEIAADAGISPYRGAGSLGDVQADVNNSVLRFRSEGVDRVIFLEALGTISLFWMPAAESQGYRPGYGLVSGNYPQFAAEFAHADSLAKSAAVGYAPVADTNESHMPFPGTPAEERCMELMAREGQQFNTRLDAIFALQFCDAAFFFQRAVEGAGSTLSVQSWVASAERMSDGFDATITPVTSFGPRKHDGATVYRALSFHADCTCTHYEGDVLPLPR